MCVDGTCDSCGGTGGEWETCWSCDGSGVCDYCDGWGCSICDYTGVCSYCDGVGEEWDECWLCDGTGECYYCNGQGWETCTYCNGQGGETCDYCDGEGGETCDECNGDGLVDCVHCNGRGWDTCIFCNGQGSRTQVGALLIPGGIIVIVKRVNVENVKVGDVIAFQRGESKTIHRVVEKAFEDDSFHFKTKGDANEDPDPWIVRPEQVRGGLLLTIPYYGYLIHFAGTPVGFVLMVITPAVLLIVNEIRKIYQLKKGEKIEQESLGNSTVD